LHHAIGDYNHQFHCLHCFYSLGFSLLMRSNSATYRCVDGNSAKK
jgi:hypothetical protein